MTRRIRVAIVEHDPAMQRSFRDILTAAGFAVTIVTEPVRLPVGWGGEVIVSDSGGREHGQRAVAARIDTLRARSSAKIVLVTPDPAALRDDALHADAILVRPFVVENLVALVRALSPA